MELGTFSISLAVKDIGKSKSFYEKFGFKVFGGDISQKWLILKNGDQVVGLFQGMFDKNILTFNPGWDKNGEPLENYTDVRDVHKRLGEEGIVFESKVDENSEGPASFLIIDPDGNPILFDQHI